MAQQTVTGFVFMGLAYNADYSAKVWTPEIWRCQLGDDEDRIFIREQQFVVDIPDDFDPTAQQVAVLEKAKRDALAEYQQKVAEINERLSNLLALTNEVAA